MFKKNPHLQTLDLLSSSKRIIHELSELYYLWIYYNLFYFPDRRDVNRYVILLTGQITYKNKDKIKYWISLLKSSLQISL